MRGSQDKVDACRLVVRIGPAVNGAALHADVAGFHMDRDAVVEMAVGQIVSKGYLEVGTGTDVEMGGC